MKLRTVAILLAMLPAACASTNSPTLAQLEATRTTNTEASTKLYPGRSPYEVRTAAHEVLKLLNPNDMRFDVRTERLLASQTWSINLILSAGAGQRWYEIVFVPEQGGTRASLGLEQEMVTTAFVAPLRNNTFKQDIVVGSDPTFSYNSTLFFDRMDYMLGLRSDWPTCAALEKERRLSPMYFCGGMWGGIGIADQAPTTAIPGSKRSAPQ